MTAKSMHRGGLPAMFAGVIALLMMTAWPGAAQAEADFVVEPLDYDFPYEVEAAAEEDKNIVIMFVQNGCPYCAKMHNRVFPNPKVNDYYTKNFYLIEVNNKGDLNVTTPEGEKMPEKDYAEKMRVRATPVFVFLGQDGEEALRLTGYQDVNMFNAAGRYVSSGAYKDGTSFLSFIRSGG